MSSKKDLSRHDLKRFLAKKSLERRAPLPSVFCSSTTFLPSFPSRLSFFGGIFFMTQNVSALKKRFLIKEEASLGPRLLASWPDGVSHDRRSRPGSLPDPGRKALNPSGGDGPWPRWQDGALPVRNWLWGSWSNWPMRFRLEICLKFRGFSLF